MAFHSMKKMGSTSNVSRKFEAITELVKDGWYMIPNFIKDPKTKTIVRMLPALDKDGRTPLDLLNPEGSYEDLENTLGMAFAKVEVFSVWLKGKHTVISTVFQDNAGNEMPEGSSPLYTIANRVRYKGYEQLKKKELGIPTDAPKDWLYWREANIINTPTEQTFIQCLLLEEAGTVLTDLNGNPAIKDKCVIMLPLSATDGLFRSLCKPHDKRLPLSDSNNKFGDIHSVDNGCCLEIYKTVAKKTEYYIETGEVMPLEAEDLAVIAPWEDVIKIPTVEESIQYCYDIFKDPAMIDYGLRESDVWSQYIPDEFRGTSDNISEAGGIRDLQAPTPVTTVTRPVVNVRKRTTPVVTHTTPNMSEPVTGASLLPDADETPTSMKTRVRVTSPVQTPSVAHEVPKEVNQTLRDNLAKMRSLRNK